MARFRFHARVTDAARPTTDAPRYDKGNRTFIATLPAGNYEIEADDGDDLARVYRVPDQVGERTFVCALPAGEYTAEDDADGTHIYSEPAGPVAVSLTEPVVDVANRAATERAALRRLNESHASFWDRQSRSAGNAAGTLAGVNERHAAFWANRR